MSCPYYKEGYFGICDAPDANAIHVPSIDEMERFCFRSWYERCPYISLLSDRNSRQPSGASGHPGQSGPEQPAGRYHN